MRTLLKNSPSAINYFTANSPIFRSAGTGSDFSKFGTGSSSQYTTTPDGATTAYEIISGENQTVTMDCNIKAVLRTGRVLAMVYSDFYGGASAATSTAYSSPSVLLQWDNTGSFDQPFMSRSVNLHPGWNCICSTPEVGTAFAGHPIWSEGHTSGGVSTWITVASSPATQTHFTRFRTRITGVGSGLTSRTYYAQLVDNLQAESRIIIRVDDARKSVYTILFPIMQALGLVGVLGVISDAVGSSAEYMTWAEINELLAAGWEIACHSKQHLNNDYGQDEAYWIAQLTAANDAIFTNTGVRPTTYISPFGNFLRTVASGYRSAVRLLFDISLGTTDANLGPFLPQGHYLPCHNVRTHTGGVTIAQHISRLRSVVAAGGSSILMLHNFTAGATTDDVDLTTADVTALLAEVFRLKEAGFAEVPTMQGLVDEIGFGFQLAA